MSHSETIPDDLHLLLRESDWLLRLARGLCSDRSLAEDLHQDAMLIAWRARGRVRGPWRPWLQGVLRRLSANRQREGARRAKREGAAAEAGVREAPATDEVVARAGLHRSVVDAVMELDEPYRTAILLRYFDDLTARQIAERQGVPVETVRTRIKRGVALLRARLDREHGSRAAWTGPLLGMVELGLPGATVGAGLMVLGSFLVMHAKFVVPLVLAAGIGLVSLWPGGHAVASDELAESAASGSPELVGQAAARSAAAAAADPTRDAVPAATAVVWRGRVVAEVDGAVVPRAHVRLLEEHQVWTELPTGGRTVRSFADLRSGPALAEARADDDGRFRVVLPKARPCYVYVGADGFAPVVSQSQNRVAGSVKDVGDVRLHGAVRISGQVRDVAGAPIADLAVRLSWQGTFRDEDAWLRFDEATGTYETDRDGRFTVPGIGRAGRWWIDFQDPKVRLVQETRAFRTLDAGEAFLDIVADKGLGELRGVVVDESGKPVAGVSVNSDDGRCMSTTQEDGTFTLDRRRGTASRFGLRVWRARFQRSEVILETEKRYEWGAKDVRLVLPSGVDLELQVVQAPAMAPVEVFDLDMQRVGARMWGPGGAPRGSGTDKRHPDGLVRLPGMVPGRYRVLVVQPGRSDVLEMTVVAGADGRQRLIVPAAQRLSVVLRDGKGKPVVGSRVDLLREGSGRPHLHLAMQPTRPGEGSGGVTGLPFARSIYRVSGGSSDGRGRVDLPVPAGGGLLLRVCGAGHAPLVRRDPGHGELELTVERGVQLSGTLTPKDIVRTLRQVSLCLESLDHPGLVFPTRFTHVVPGKMGSIVQPDGSFVFRGVPAGRWRVYLSYLAPGRGGAAVYQIVPVTELEIEEKDWRIVLDCAKALPVRVNGQALFRGKPAKLARLDLSGPPVLGQILFGAFDCDADGRFAGELTPGRYRVKAVVQDEKGREVACEYPQELVVQRRGNAWPTLDLVPVETK